MELPPLNQFLARRLIERSRVAETLGEWRGASAVDIGRAGACAAARVGDGVRAAAAARDGHQPDHRRRGRRAGRSMRASWSRQHAAVAGRPATGSTTTTTWRSCRTPRATGGSGRCGRRRPLHRAAGAPGRRADAAGAVRGLSPESRYFRFVSRLPRAAAVDAGALHADRLRPRDGVGGGGDGAQRVARGHRARKRAHHRRVALRHQSRPDQLRVLAGGADELSAARASARG